MTTEPKQTILGFAAVSEWTSSPIKKNSQGSSNQLDHETWYALHQPYVDITHLIACIGGPVSLILGSLGNGVLFLILVRLSSSSSPYNVFFKVLVVSHQLVLVLGPMESVLRDYFDQTYISSHSSWLCKLHRMTLHAASVSPSWMLVALTMLKAASALWPRSVNAVWTKRKSRTTAGTIIAIIILINLYLTRQYLIRKGDCVMHEKAMHVEMFHLFQICVLPFAMLVLSNSALVWTLVRSIRARKHVLEKRATQTTLKLKVSSLTVTLIAASVSLVLLTVPYGMAPTMYYYMPRVDPNGVGCFMVFNAVSCFLFYCNSTVNFCLFFTASNFRAELRQILRECTGLCHDRKKAGSKLTASRHLI